MIHHPTGGRSGLEREKLIQIHLWSWAARSLAEVPISPKSLSPNQVFNPDRPRHCSPQILPSLHTQSAKAQGEPWSCLVVGGPSFPTLEKKDRAPTNPAGWKLP